MALGEFIESVYTFHTSKVARSVMNLVLYENRWFQIAVISKLILFMFQKDVDVVKLMMMWFIIIYNYLYED